MVVTKRGSTAAPAKKATATKAAAPAASTRRAAPAKAAPKKRAPAPVEDEPDLLAGMDDPDAGVDDDDDYDLLSDLSEENGTAWMPWDEEDQPNGIQGRITVISTVTADQKYGGGEVPYWEITSKDGTVWGIRGYSTVLGNQMEREQDRGASIGHLAAIKHLGEKENRKGDNTYRDFRVVTKG